MVHCRPQQQRAQRCESDDAIFVPIREHQGSIAICRRKVYTYYIEEDAVESGAGKCGLKTH